MGLGSGLETKPQWPRFRLHRSHGPPPGIRAAALWRVRNTPHPPPTLSLRSWSPLHSQKQGLSATVPAQPPNQPSLIWLLAPPAGLAGHGAGGPLREGAQAPGSQESTYEPPEGQGESPSRDRTASLLPSRTSLKASMGHSCLVADNTSFLRRKTKKTKPKSQNPKLCFDHKHKIN